MFSVLVNTLLNNVVSLTNKHITFTLFRYHALANCWLFDQSSRQSLQVLEECLESNKTDSSLSARAMNIEVQLLLDVLN